ncbi:MAG: helix-turn-helix transcriptional regulator [Candidatus Limnocylindria bacterium]
MGRVSSPDFIGRTSELERLCRALEQASDQRTATWLVAGEAGIGKTRLVGELATRARDVGAQVLVGHCLQLGDTGLPYAPFVGALRPLLRSTPPERLDALIGPGRAELARLLPDLGPVDRPRRIPDGLLSAPADQARLFEIVFGLLRRLAEERPLVLVLEDLHWADSSTRDLLRFLVRNARDVRVLFIATYRSDELHRRHPLRPLLAELQRLASVESIELDAFGPTELAEQLRGITGEQPAPELVTEVLSRSGGNPFFVEELIAAGEAGLALPRSLRDTLEDRIRRLGPDAQRLLRVASVGGARIDHRLLVAVAGMPEAALTKGLRDAVEHHLLVASAPDEVPGYAFRHALAQEAVYEELLPSERTRLHAAFATAIEAQSGPSLADPAAEAAQLAHHWLMAHDLDRALPASLRAARIAAAGFAFAEAQAFHDRALELWPKVPASSLPGDTDRVTVLEEAAEAAAQAGDPRRSTEYVRAALAETDPIAEPMRAGTLQHRLAWYLNESGDWQEGVTALERAVTLIPIDPPTRERARVLSDLAHSLMVRSRFGDSLALAEAALAISRAVGAPVAEARALNALGLDLACRSDLDRAIPMLRDAHTLASEIGEVQAIFLTGVGLGWALDETGRHEDALTVALGTRDRLRALGAEARFGGHLASKAARAMFELGRWDEALALLDETIAAEPTRYAMRWLLSNRIWLNVRRGQLNRARRDLATYAALGERVVGSDPDMIGARRAELAIVAGEPVSARALIAETLERLVEPELDSDGRGLRIIGLQAEADEADAARAAGDRERAAVAVERAVEIEDGMRRHLARVAELVAQPARVIDADRALAEALAARATGAGDPALWRAAVEGRRALGRPYEIAAALVELAAADLAQRRREDGAASLAEAHTIAVGLGANPLRTRIEVLARRARIGLEGVDSADDAADRLGLTRREREVLALLADGRSNRQIGEELYMAESTAGVHVSNILGKLGVTRRSEAAAVAHRLGLFGLA